MNSKPSGLTTMKKIKNGDIVEFLAISWNEPQWEFDYPTVVLKPVIRYSPNGTSPDGMIEDLALDMCCDGKIMNEDVSEEFKWRKWQLRTLNKVAKERLNGKDTWKSKIREVVYKKIRFFEKNGELEFEDTHIKTS